jgi:LacI family transcriptional regulator
MASATIRDVARQADVSVASVSRALNGHSNVHPETRARVVEAAKALGYVPHAGARSLSLARNHAIGVVLPDLHGEFFSEIVRGIDRETTARGYHLLLSNMHADAELAAQAMRSMRGRVDGLIVMAPQLDPAALNEALPKGTPAVLVNTSDGGERQAMRVDNRAGMETIVRHLLFTGRRSLVHIAGPAGNIDARERPSTRRTCPFGLWKVISAKKPAHARRRRCWMRASRWTQSSRPTT